MSFHKFHMIKMPLFTLYNFNKLNTKKYEVKLSRIRIGHTRLTHGHLMTRNINATEQKNPNSTLKSRETLVLDEPITHQSYLK